ncbi:VanZ family protein [Streptomyces sp. XD-27]|uniref:VanZ family protein n=1 Tax=Streptomyces sp. XD-27 TaxID=3062779 RepID=UPI0026F45D65|nr:VanZ family protein [Streptomyces sp. XD-27]WKX71325.1 VanZ family protein [Streptomyces sp. XD-27]
MTETYLLPIRTAALLFPALALLMFVPTAIVLYRRHGVITRWRVLSVYGGVYYALTAFCMTIVPLPKPSVDVCKAYPSFAEPQFTPGVAFADIWKEAHHRVTLDALILHNSAVWQTAFNLVLLLPLGMFVRIHFRRGLAAATTAGFAGSLLFELTQYSGLWGLYECPYRLFAVDDLIVNTAGAALGWAIAGPLARALPALDTLDDRALAAGKVPFGRRLVALLLDVTGVALLTPVVAVALHVVLGAATVLWVPPTVLGLWFVVIPWRTGATPGKHVLLLRLTTPDGGRPAPAGLALRALVLSPLLVLACLAAGAVVGTAASAVLAGGSASAARPSTLLDVARRVNYQDVVYSLAADPVFGLVLLLPPVLCLTLAGAYVGAIRRHPQGLGPHEVLSGIRNQALPHTRARSRPDTPAPADPRASTPLATAGSSGTGR